MSEALTTPVSTEVSPEAAAPIQPVENAAAQTVQAPAVDQPLTFATQADFDKAVDARLEAVKQQWLNESYQNTQSMNDKFSAQVNAKLQQLQKLGIKADAVQAAKLVKAEQQAAQQAQPAQPAQSRQNIDPGYQQLLSRFGTNAAGDERLQNAYALEQEYGIQLGKDDAEFQKYFSDPKRNFSTSFFTRTYEKALMEKQARLANQPTAQAPNPAALPSLSGTGAKSNVVENKTPSSDLLALGAEEMRRSMSKNW